MLRFPLYVLWAAFLYVHCFSDTIVTKKRTSLLKEILSQGKPAQEQRQKNPNQATTKSNTCTCAVMNSETDTDPIIQKTVDMPHPCDKVGSSACQRLCVERGKVVFENENALSSLCSHVGTVTDLKIHIFSRACASGPFLFTGLQCIDVFNCKNGEFIPHGNNTKFLCMY